MVDNHIDIPYPKSMTHIPYRYSYRYPIDVQSPLSIHHIDIGSYFVTLAASPASKVRPLEAIAHATEWWR